ncbi:acyl-CoA synthetase (NDP forming) [Thermocatellispora tengchongensis]|uniref:Acyl-CoA synthetase (NDP forming) n=1 Tax=Thermocatellispora tengchongensis TaxID=1073253 RepID=A0A840P5Y5_9ACTN|nr:acetate--CoA ligase family protein [Thermocatellispora tengchongensis]MBB5133271.1 acyl-CoA synthetase (NDP forming) [Thermocatellispora tengchongensis]
MNGGLPELKELLRDAGVPVPPGAAVPDADSVEKAASGLRPPLVVKAYGPGLLHKSDAGAVRLGLPDAAAAGAAAREMDGRLAARGVVPGGFLVEEQAAPGVELIMGLVRDPGFGPMVLAGLGGVWAEVLRDTALRLCPIGEDDARAMLAELRAAPLLRGHRGAPPADLDALAALLVALAGPGGLWQRLDLGEFELNPVIATPDGAVAVDVRHVPGQTAPPTAPVPGRATDFLRLFEPRKVAVVGASAGRSNFGTMFLEFYKETGVPLVAVHPGAAEIAGVPCVPSLAAAEADYALVAVPAERCAEVVREAAGTPFVQVMSGGFAEAGRADLEARLAEAARAAGSRLLGPNCMGVYCPRGRQTFVGGGLGPEGGIALISQSGGLAGEVVRVGEHRGLAFGRVVTVGNAADVTPAELLRWLAGDPHTSAVGLYLEDPRAGRALFEALMSVRGVLPAVLLAGGRSAQGRRAAASHTGGLVSDARVWQAVAAQAGAALVASQDDLIGALLFLQCHRGRLGGGDPDAGVLVIGPSGGASVLAADAFDAVGLLLAPLPAPAAEALREAGLGLGAGTSAANPLEAPVGPRSRPDLAAAAIRAIVPHGAYADVVAHVNAQSFFTYGDGAEPLLAYARHLAAAQAALPATRITLVTRNGECAPPGVVAEVRAIVTGAGVPVYGSMEAAAAAVAAGRAAGRR